LSNTARIEQTIGDYDEGRIHGNYRSCTRRRLLVYLSGYSRANGQGETIEKTKENLRQVSKLILKDLRLLLKERKKLTREKVPIPSMYIADSAVGIRLMRKV
jgi:predicted RNase H-like HicB family nuclease